MIKQATAGLIALGALSAGVDATTLNVPSVAFDSVIKENRVQVVERENVVEATMPWKDTPGLKVKYDMGVPTVSEKVKDKRNQQVIVETINTQEVELKRKKDQLTKYKADIETSGTPSVQIDGLVIAATSTEESIRIADQQIGSAQEDLNTHDGLKIDVILNEKPNTNTFCYQIEGWEDYDFFYQPALTPEEIAEGAQRPEEIVGSYAVYHKTLKNHKVGETNYETGKVAHIPYPYVWSVNATSSTKHRAEAFSIENGEMCVTVGWSFLLGAEYPVRIDPTFGYTSAGASSDSSSGYVKTNKYTTSEGGTITSFSWYMLNNGASQFSHGVLYGGGSGSQNRLDYSTEDTSNNDNRWTTQTAVAGYTFLGSTTYRLGFFHFLNQTTVAYDSGIEVSYFSDGTYQYPANNTGTFTDTGYGSQKYSIYATYTASGGGGTSSTDSGVLIFE
jgi:hypothetical protein